MSHRTRLGAGAALCAAIAAVACSSSDTATPAGPAGPASIRIDGLQPSGGPRAVRDDSCVELGRDATGTVGIEITAGNWTFRPPGACGATPQCGTVTLTVDPAASTPLIVRAAIDFIPAPLARLPTPTGSHVFHVALTNNDGTTFVDKTTKQPLEDEITIDVTDPGGCGGKPLDAGTDAADAATDAADAATDAADAATDAADAATDAAADAADAATDAADAATDAADAATDAAADAPPG